MKGTLAPLALLGLLACSPSPRPDATCETGALRIGVLPDRSEGEARTRVEHLVAHLERHLGQEVQLVVPDDYSEMLARFEHGEIDIARLGGLTFLRAERQSQAEPLVMRDVDFEFTSDILVASSAPGRSIHEFEGQRFAFGPRLSTSGHLMPRDYLLERGIVPETFFSEVRYSSGHDETAAWVRDGEVDIAAVNSIYFESMLRDGQLSREDVYPICRTPPYRNYVWAVRRDLDAVVRARLMDAFLALDATDPAHAPILATLGAGSFLPASKEDYAGLRLAAERRGLLNGTGLE